MQKPFIFWRAVSSWGGFVGLLVWCDTMGEGCFPWETIWVLSLLLKRAGPVMKGLGVWPQKLLPSKWAVKLIGSFGMSKPIVMPLTPVLDLLLLGSPNPTRL